MINLLLQCFFFSEIIRESINSHDCGHGKTNQQDLLTSGCLVEFLVVNPVERLTISTTVWDKKGGNID
jgi:hypothetical protein